MFETQTLSKKESVYLWFTAERISCFENNDYAKRLNHQDDVYVATFQLGTIPEHTIMLLNIWDRGVKPQHNQSNNYYLFWQLIAFFYCSSNKLQQCLWKSHVIKNCSFIWLTIALALFYPYFMWELAFYNLYFH